MLLCEFSMCSVNVRCALFRAFCTRRPTVAHNDTMRLLLQVPRWHSPSQSLVFSGIHTCEALLMWSMYTFTCRLVESENCMDCQLLSALIKAQKELLTHEFLNWVQCCGLLFQVFTMNLLESRIKVEYKSTMRYLKSKMMVIPELCFIVFKHPAQIFCYTTNRSKLSHTFTYWN